MNVALTSLSVLALAAAAWCQDWTPAELDDHCRAFLEDNEQAQVAEIGEIVQAAGPAIPALAARLHGNHREYLLKIEQLVSQLTDERWLERERAERTLVEIGARARDRLAEHAEQGATLEERLRCQRVLQKLDERGTEKEERDARELHGLARAALHLPPDERVRRALMSALGHTDRRIVEDATRALGVQGRDDDVAAIRPLLNDSALRRAALASIGRMPGAPAEQAALDLLRSNDLADQDAATVLRAVRRRPDGADLLAQLSDDAPPFVASAAPMTVPAASGDGPAAAVMLPDGTRMAGRFAGLTGDTVLLAGIDKGPPVLEMPFARCRSVVFPDAKAAGAPAAARLFTTQGSLLTGSVVGVSDQQVQLHSMRFGDLTFPTNAVQGIALDPKLDRLIGASQHEDRVRMHDGTLLDGSVVGWSDTTLELQQANGTKQVPLADVAGVLFRRPEATSTNSGTFSRLDLTNGDRLLAHVVGANRGSLAVMVPGVGAGIVPSTDLERLEFDVPGGAMWGFTLVADYSDNRVVEFDEQGNQVFVMNGVYGAFDVECLPSGNLLLTEFSVSRVREVTRDGEQVWSFEDLRNPYDADRLPNGNTLIADTFNGRVIEVSPAGKIVWSYAKDIRPFDVQRLDNGNTLIVDVQKDRVIEVTSAGDIVWERDNLPSIHDADRLPNGNTLVTQRTLNRVVELDPGGNEVWRLEGLSAPSDADRLPNGNTLVAENNMVREFAPDGHVVWQQPMTWAVEANRY